jgi:hypothetical protein
LIGEIRYGRKASLHRRQEGTARLGILQRKYWFATEKTGEQLSDFGDGKGVPDTIYYGLVQGFEEEWGYFSQAEIERLKPKT